MSEDNKYLYIIRVKCVTTSKDTPSLIVGNNYRVGVRYCQSYKKEMYYLLDVKNSLGTPLKVLKEDGVFKEEALSSISFITT